MPERWSSRKSHNDLNEKLEHQHEMLHQIKEGIIIMSAALDRITREVSETKTAVDSAITLINGLAQQIRDNAEDPAALEALADELDAKQAEIATAVSANTPAQPAPDEPTE